MLSNLHIVNKFIVHKNDASRKGREGRKVKKTTTLGAFLRRWFLNDFGPPPAPDVEHLPSFDGQQIVETIYTASKNERAIITVDAVGSYRIHLESWDVSDWERSGKAFWYGHNIGSHSDTIERARECAHEALGDYGSGTV